MIMFGLKCPLDICNAGCSDQLTDMELNWMYGTMYYALLDCDISASVIIVCFVQFASSLISFEVKIIDKSHCYHRLMSIRQVSFKMSMYSS